MHGIYPSNNMATMTDLIDETLAEIIANPTVKFIDLDTQVPPHMRLPADEPCVGDAE